VGTIGHPASNRAATVWDVELRPQRATANVTAGTGGRDTIWTRGNGSERGWLFSMRRGLAFLMPLRTAASGVGTRPCSVGLTIRLMSASVVLTSGPGHYCGFFAAIQETLVLKMGKLAVRQQEQTPCLQLQDTGLEVSAATCHLISGCLHHPHTTEVFWSIADLTTGQIAGRAPRP